MLGNLIGGRSGVYSTEDSGATYTFKGNTVTGTDKDVVGNYDVKDGNVYITAYGRTQAFDIDDNCILLGPPYGRACKK